MGQIMSPACLFNNLVLSIFLGMYSLNAGPYSVQLDNHMCSTISFKKPAVLSATSRFCSNDG